MRSVMARYLLSMAAVSLVILLIGLTLVSAVSRDAVLVGVGVAFAAQAIAYALLEGVFFTGKRVLVYSGGMLVRFAVVMWMLFAAERLFGVALLPAIISMLVVLSVTTLLEPVFSHSDS
ncbi:hypothetical protein BH23GEM8_BH23GEM8_24080 [soil metagenome]